MTEPLLVYKKGEGWIYSNYQQSKIFNYEGKPHYLECRKPNPGERWHAASKAYFEYWSKANDCPNWDYWIGATGWLHYDDLTRHGKWEFFVTLVPA